MTVGIGQSPTISEIERAIELQTALQQTLREMAEDRLGEPASALYMAEANACEVRIAAFWRMLREMV